MTAYLRRYRLSAAMTTAVTVVPSEAAFSTAAVQMSSGMRSERGMVAMSADHNPASTEQTLSLDGLLGRRPGEDVPRSDGLTNEPRAGRFGAVRVAADTHRGEGLARDTGGAHRLPLRRDVSTFCAPTYLHVNPSGRVA